MLESGAEGIAPGATVAVGLAIRAFLAFAVVADLEPVGNRMALHEDKRQLAESILEGSAAGGKLSIAALGALIREGAADHRFGSTS